MHHFGKLSTRRTAVTETGTENLVDVPSCIDAILQRGAGKTQVVSPFIQTHRFAVRCIAARRLLTHGFNHLLAAPLLVANSATGNKVWWIIVRLTVVKVIDV